ncbi:hypothetical protein KPL71_007503 [Citrus sinensis]|uniref:Uncharacterized protein n=1 Tax=Citrus sinensis TaxID=2711 RepID=A0ACB8M0V6_CITSI|nr:hypothetical protein KPL71_007503 [Citrus sinensis]
MELHIRKSEDNTSREFEKAARRLENARLVLRRFPNIEKLRSRASKDDPLELRSPVTKEELVAELLILLSIFYFTDTIYTNLGGKTPLSAFGEYEVPMRLPKGLELTSRLRPWRNSFVSTRHGVKIVADALVSDCRDAVFDLIALPGGMPGATNLKESEVLETIVKKQASAGRLYAAVCASPAVALGSWGLLKGLKATCYPSFMEQLAPACAATVESRVQQDGKVVTSRGPGTAMI